MQQGQFVRIECYIQRTLLTVPGKEAYLREKSSNKRVEFINSDAELERKLRLFFEVAAKDKRVMSTIETRFGMDIVVVNGSYVGETDDVIQIDLNTPNGGFYFEHLNFRKEQ